MLRSWIGEEAAMAAVIFNSEHRKDAARARPNAGIAAVRAVLDAFVSNRLRHAAAQSSHGFDASPPDPASREVRLQPLDPNVVNPAIPAFFIGRNHAGLWVAREAKGRIGGIFLLKSSALAFARAQSEPAGCAMIFQSERFELDLQNNGNRFASWLTPRQSADAPRTSVPRRRAPARCTNRY
jgi:hypothetical protein